MCLIGGCIRAAWLTAKVFDQLQADCLKEIGVLVQEGGLVLASTCGLYPSGFLRISEDSTNCEPVDTVVRVYLHPSL